MDHPAKQPPEATPPLDDEKLFLSAEEALHHGTRHILVMGAKGTGKTTFSVSASKFADDTIGGPRRMCSDVLLVQGDNEGHLGAMDAGLVPGMVLNMGKCKSWDGSIKTPEGLVKDPQSYISRWSRAYKRLGKVLSDGTIKIIIVDLNWPAKLIEKGITVSLEDRNYWKLVSLQGQRLYDAFNRFDGVTVIGNAQMKVHAIWGEDTRKGPSENSINVANVRSVGGERSSHTIDLAKGVASVWQDNASFIFTRKSMRGKEINGEVPRIYKTVTQSTSQYEAKSRAQSVLKTIEPGELSLRSLLKRVYGEDV